MEAVVHLQWGLFRSRSGKKLFCSFCGKDSDSVQALIAGPAVYICDECVEICNKCLAGKPQKVPAPWEKCTDEELLEQLKRSAAIADAANDFLGRHVDMLRKREVSWAEIGKALGISRQAAWERFS